MSSDNKPFFIRPSKLNVEKIQNNFGNYTSTTTTTTTNSILNNKTSNDNDSTTTTTTIEGSKGQDVVTIDNCTSSVQQQQSEVKSNHVSNSATTTTPATTSTTTNSSSILTKSIIKDGESNKFVFGSNLSERVTEDSVVLKNSEEKEPADTSTSNELSRKRKNSDGSSSQDKDVDDGLTGQGDHEIVFEEKKPKKVQEIPGIDYTTGEENEKNVLQLSCKLFAFQNSNWVEKCTGMLRLNDIIQPSTSPASAASSSSPPEESSNKINSSIIEAPNRVDLIRPSKFSFTPSSTTISGSINHKPDHTDVNINTSDSGDTEDNTNSENQIDDKVPDNESAGGVKQQDLQGEIIENKQVHELIATTNSDNNVESLLSHKACSPTVVINSPPRHTSSSTEEMTMTLRSRLIVRARGSLRLLFNSFIFPSMVLERAGDKSIRFTASPADSSTEIGIYLLMLSSSSDADKLYYALEYRKRELK